MPVRKLRVLRIKHGVSLHELSRACGISHQRLSEIELNATDSEITQDTVRKLREGFYKVLTQRTKKLIYLYEDIRKHEKSLFVLVEETDNDI